MYAQVSRPAEHNFPFMLWRLDSRAKLYGVKLKREPSNYIRENMYVTLSGMYSAEPLNCSIAALGQSRDPHNPQFTDHCFTGDYPTGLTDQTGSGLTDQLSFLAEVR